MNAQELAAFVNHALGKPDTYEWPADSAWDSLDQLEIITHLNDRLGDRVNTIEALNNVENLDQLTQILRAEGLVA